MSECFQDVLEGLRESQLANVCTAVKSWLINKISYYFFKSSSNFVGLKRQHNRFHWFIHQRICPVETWDCYEKLHQLGSDQVSLHMVAVPVNRVLRQVLERGQAPALRGWQRVTRRRRAWWVRNRWPIVTDPNSYVYMVLYGQPCP